MSTVGQVKHVFDAALTLMKLREVDYEDSWRREGLHCMAGSMYRKASGLEIAFKNGNYRKKPEKTKEDLLDLMNYSSIVYKLLEDELGENAG